MNRTFLLLRLWIAWVSLSRSRVIKVLLAGPLPHQTLKSEQMCLSFPIRYLPHQGTVAGF